MTDQRKSNRPGAAGLLTGLKVLDFSKVLAGPLCTQHLADMGATVTKIEAIEIGDETRRWPPYRDDTGAVFISVNRNKRSVAVDLQQESGREIIYRLVRDVDIVIESFAPGVTEKLGIDYDRIRHERESIIYCSISGFGQTGPLSRAPGYDLILQAFSGLLTMTGEPGGPPIRAAMSPIDQATGMNALMGILGSIIRRDRTGEGAYLDVSLFDSSVTLLSYVLQNYWVSGKEPTKSGTGHPSLCPYQVFQARDQEILIGVPNDNLWRRFCGAAGHPECGTDPRFATNGARVEHFDETIALVQSWVGEHNVGEWMERLGQAGVPAAPLHTLGHLVNHPQTAARGIIQSYEHSKLGALNAVLLPMLVDGCAREIGQGPPAHGQHTADVLAELGYTADEVASLAATGAVRSVDR